MIMVRKVFISFLGFTNYGECVYVKDNFKSASVRYIQEANLDYLTRSETWTDNDVAYILLTDGAEKVNWEDNGQRDKERNVIIQPGLRTQLEKMNLPMRIEPIKNLPDGNNESEIWSIFNRIFEKIQEGDELYFDLTHGFRYLPMLSLVLGNYCRFLKSTVVKQISYGNYEGRNRDTNEAPIIDLMPFTLLQEYTDMANSLTTFGRIKEISKALKNTQGDEDVFVTKICDAIESFDDDLICNRMNSIKSGKNIIEIHNNIKKVRQLYSKSPVLNVLDSLVSELNEFKPEDSHDNIVAAINWSIKYKMLPQAYTLFQEYIILRLSEKYSECNPYRDLEKSNTEKRKYYKIFLSSLCAIPNEDIANGEFKGELKTYKECALELLQIPQISEIRKYYNSISSHRNSINHAKGNATYGELVEEFNKNYYPCLSLLKE